MHLNKNSSNFYVSWWTASELLCSIKGEPSESLHVTQHSQMPWSRWSSNSVHVCRKPCHQNDARQLGIFLYAYEQQFGGNGWRQSPRHFLPSQTNVELFQKKLEQELGALCPSLAFQLLTWRDKAPKIAASCRISPNAVAFSLPSKAWWGMRDEGIKLFPSFLKAYIWWERDEAVKHCGIPSLTSSIAQV